MMFFSEFHQRSGGNIQGFSQNADVHEGNVALTSLHATHIAASQPAFERQLFLRQPLGFSQRCQPFAELFLDVQHGTQRKKMLCAGLLSGHVL